MRDFITTIKRLFRRPVVPAPAASESVVWTPEIVEELLQTVALTEGDDYACADCDRLLARFTEAMAAGEAAAVLMPRVEKHLQMCPHCREEFEALLRILQGATDASPQG